MYSSQTARLVIIVAIIALLGACQTANWSSKSKLSAEFKSVRKNFLTCTERVSKDPAIQIIRARTPLQPKDNPSQQMKAVPDLITDKEIGAMVRFEELSSKCRENLITASGAIDSRYSTALTDGYAEQDKLAETLKKRQDTWGGYNSKYENLKIEVNKNIAIIDKDLII